MKPHLRAAAMILLASVLLCVLAADFLAPVPYDKQFRDQPNAPPSRQFLLGSDELGRDRFSRLLHGARVSLLLAPAAALFATAAAALAGGLAGWLGGWPDRVLMSCADILLSAPWMFLLITVRALLPLNTPPFVSIALTFALLACLGWATPARAIRAGVQSVAQSDFLLQAKALGCSRARLFRIHVLPNLKPLLGAQFWTAVPMFLLAEANLSLLGLGVTEPMPSLGNLLRELENVHAVRANAFLLAPLVLLAVLVICCHIALERDSEAPQ